MSNHSGFTMSESREHELVWFDSQPDRIDPEFKKVWIEELRSGKYHQARSALKAYNFGPDHNEYGYCCLGVAGDVMCRLKPEQYYWDDKDYKNLIVLDDDKVPHMDKTLMPIPMAQQLGFSSFDRAAGGVAQWKIRTHKNCTLDIDCKNSKCTYSYGGDTQESIMLTELNDDGFTFDQIADVIEYFL